MAIDPRLINIAIEELPGAISWLKGLFAAAHPDAPVPTTAEVIAAYHSALVSGLARGQAWLDSHPK